MNELQVQSRKLGLVDRVKEIIRTWSVSSAMSGNFGGDGYGQNAPRPVSVDNALTLSGVFGCSSLLANIISTMPFDVFEKQRDGSMRELGDHNLAEIFGMAPNRWQTVLDLLQFGTLSQEFWGNEYHYIERRASGEIISLTPLAPDTTKAEWDDRGMTRDIRYRFNDRGKDETAPSDRIFHIRGFGGGPLGGLSTLAYARRVMNIAIATDDTAQAMYRNKLNPSGGLKVKEWLKGDQRATARSIVEKEFGGAANAGRAMLLEGGMEWEQFTIDPVDAQMLESRQFSIEEICRFFGVPPFLIGHTDKGSNWGTGLEQQLLAFLKFALSVRLRRREVAIVKQLLPRHEWGRITIKANVEALLRPDSAARAAFFSQMTQNGLMTRNEARGKENLPPIEGGDLATVQSALIDLASLGNGTAPTDNVRDSLRSMLGIDEVATRLAEIAKGLEQR